MSPIRFLIAPAAFALASAATAQVPDLLNAFDAGSTSLGAGGALQASSSDTLASYFNPAGLGYLYRPQIGAAYRNLPETKSFVTGNLGNLSRSTMAESGSSTITHLGYALPFRDVFKRGGGTLAFSYTVGGYVNDQSGTGAKALVNIGGGLGIADFRENRLARSDFYTVAYGRTNAAQNLSFGFGITFVQQRLELVQTGVVVDAQGNPQPGSLSPLVDRRGTASGVGVIAGVQFQPPSIPGVSFALSARTPISLSGADAGSLYNRLPGRLIEGATFRTKGFRKGGEDYGVFGVQFTQFFSSGEGVLFARDAQSGASVGYEYVLVNGARRIPLRIGYTSTGDGGAAFESRRGLTYGIGYRMNDRISFDVNFMRPSGAPNETIFTASYRF